MGIGVSVGDGGLSVGVLIGGVVVGGSTGAAGWMEAHALKRKAANITSMIRE